LSIFGLEEAIMRKAVHSLTQLTQGIVIGGLVLGIPVLASQHWQEASDMNLLDWVNSNLGYSVFAFGLVTGFFGYYLMQLKILLEDVHTPVEDMQSDVSHLDTMLDIFISLSFGIGVIWTAIGMRNALVNGLADIGNSANSNAFLILERLVDGGILVALSTTIVGGILGYLLRTVKSVVVGKELNDFYTELDGTVFKDIREEIHVLRKHFVKIED
jgi:hypothetical protein